MKISGPFHNAKRSAWYLLARRLVKNRDGSPLVVDGKAVTRRWRPHYDTRAKAVADMERIKQQSEVAGVSAGGVLTRQQAVEFEQAKTIVPEVSLVEQARFWRLHHPEKTQASLSEWKGPFLADVEARLGKTRHWEDLSSRVSILCQAFGPRLPATVTRVEALDYLKALGLSGRTILNQKRAACNFFAWLIEKGVVAENPFGGIKKRQLPKVAANEIRFLSIDETRRYLRACERYDPKLVAHEVVQFFSGVRSDDEMANFEGDWVLPATREIAIPASATKSGKREVISGLEDNFWAWWTRYGRKGPLRPKNYGPRWDRIRALAAIDLTNVRDELARLPIKTLFQKPGLRDKLREWPWNARRRTFCTYHVSKYQSADKTALILRQRGGTYTLHNSYRGLGVTQPMGEAYFKILPEPVKKPILPVLPKRGIVRTQSEAEQAFGAGSESVA